MTEDTPHLGRAEADAAMRAEADRLLDFALASRVEHGFGWLDDSGRVVDRPLELWLTCRMTHVAALGLLGGRGEFADLVDHGVRALTDSFQDRTHGGWFASIDGAQSGLSAALSSPEPAEGVSKGRPRDESSSGLSAALSSPEPAEGVSKGRPRDEAVSKPRPIDDRKQAYPHAFVLLAASSAVVAGRPGAAELLTAAREVHEQHFWIASKSLVQESFSADWSTSEPYLGVNATMHTVEAYLALHDVTGEPHYLDRAEAMTRQVADWASARDWRIPEHFDEDARVMPDYNRDRPADPFRPFGATVGHGLEWSRLALSVRASRLLLDASYDGDELLTAATELADRAVTDGWAVDGADGFVYTTDWDGRPVVRARMHWVVCEAIGAAYALELATGEKRWGDSLLTWWSYAQEKLIDSVAGSWHHELDAHNRVAHGTWEGKPDVYHALQACLLVGDRLPLAPSFATALSRREDRHNGKSGQRGRSW